MSLSQPKQWSKGITIDSCSDESDSEAVMSPQTASLAQGLGREWGYALDNDSSDDEGDVDAHDASHASFLVQSSPYRWSTTLESSSSSEDENDTTLASTRTCAIEQLDVQRSAEISAKSDAICLLTPEYGPEDAVSVAHCDEAATTRVPSSPPLPEHAGSTNLSNMATKDDTVMEATDGVDALQLSPCLYGGQGEEVAPLTVHLPPPLEETGVMHGNTVANAPIPSTITKTVGSAEGCEGDILDGVDGEEGQRESNHSNVCDAVVSHTGDANDSRKKKKKKKSNKKKGKTHAPSNPAAVPVPSKSVILAAMDAADLVRKDQMHVEQEGYPAASTVATPLAGEDGSSVVSCPIVFEYSASARKVVYGPARSQYFLLYMPSPGGEEVSAADDNREYQSRSVPVAVIIHGGFWKSKYGIENSAIDSLPDSLLSAGMAVCVVEYRRVGASTIDDEGGFPRSNEDILEALRRLHALVTKRDNDVSADAVTEEDASLGGWGLGRVDMDRVALIGHSAGGYLALWTCCNLTTRELPFTPAVCVAIAPVCNLEEACRRK